MRVLLALLAVAAALAGSARAETFVVAPVPESLPAAGLANPTGTIAPDSFSAPPAVPEVRSYPQLLDLWQRAGDAYGVPWQVLAAINKIESGFGQNMGPSSAGAVGWMQFLPSTWELWGTDANGDGVADPWHPDDAIFSAARYLAAAGAQADLPRAVFAYNHAEWYVADVLRLAGLFAGGADLAVAIPLAASEPQLVFHVDDLPERLAHAQRAVARASEAVVQAEEALDGLDWKRLAAEQLAGDPSLGEEDFRRLEAEVENLALDQDEARALVEDRDGQLDEAVARLEYLREEAAAVSFTRPTTELLGGATLADGYVFPVAGGPGLVSTSHDHRDYPAADIVAPEGAPVYAHTSGIVVDAWPAPAGRCGIGFQLRTPTGAEYVYCHFSYLEPTVGPGAVLAAGASVGLVGTTGHSSGPHLHLQLASAVAFPQDEAWFQSFAGIAFAWRDEPTRPPTTPVDPVFAVVDDTVATFTE